MSDKELEEYINKIEPNFDSHLEKGTIEMSNEYYNLLEEKMARLINKNQELKKQYCERTDCSGRLGNSKKVDQLEKELEQLKEIEKEHQKINGSLHLEIRRLKEELEQWKKKYGSL